MASIKERVALGSIAASAGLTAAKAVVGLLSGSLEPAIRLDSSAPTSSSFPRLLTELSAPGRPTAGRGLHHVVARLDSASR
jgi:hypothetical protein